MNQQRESNRFQAGLSTITSILTAIPAGTSLIITLSTVIFVLNLFTSWNVSGATCVASTNVTNGLPLKLYSVFTFHFAHAGIWHQLLTTILFPLSSSLFESKVGSFQFLYLFFIGGALAASLYTVIVWLISWAIPSWGLACIGGLDTAFFLFLTIDALSNQGLYDATVRMGVKIPNVLFPLPFLVIFFILMPFTSWMAHLFAIAVGIVQFSGSLDFLMLSSRALNALDTSPYLSWISNQPGFVMKPGDVSLPMPGAFDTNRPTSSINEGGSLFTRISNALRTDKYQPIQSYEGVERQADPLLWDEDDESDQNANTRLVQPSSPTNPKV